MDAKGLLVLAFQVAIFATVFGYGLMAARDDLLYLVRRPGLLLRSFLAVQIAMPILAVVLVKVLDLPTAAEVMLVALAVSPIPPLLPRREKKAGGVVAYGLGLMLVLAVAAIVTVPLTVAILDHVFDRPLAMRPDAIAKIVGLTVVAPMAAGVLVCRIAPRVAAALATPVRWIANGVLVAATLVLLAGTWQTIWVSTGHGTVLALLAFVATGLLVGHVLGGPLPEQASVLALSTACRHPAIALAVASANYPHEHFGGTLILYLILSLVVCMPYLRWQRRRTSPIVGSS